MKTLSTSKKENNHRAGFSLVELLVSATIILVSTYTIIFLIRYSERQSVNNNHRETARKVLISLFESERWQEDNYALLMTNDTTTMNVVIDDRETPSDAADDLYGTLTYRNVFIDSTNAVNISMHKIPYVVVRGVIKWQELEKDMDSIFVEKIICKLN